MLQSHQYLIARFLVSTPGPEEIMNCAFLLSLGLRQGGRAYPSPDVLMTGVVLGA